MMRALFVTMVWPPKGTDNLYSDLVSEFSERGHDVDVIALSEKRSGIRTHIETGPHLRVLHVKCGNIQKVNKYAKVINSFLAGFSLFFGALHYLRRGKYDCMIFALPPLTITPALVLMKKLWRTKLYLLLKEFWPQDPVDLGALRKGGVVWAAFRCLEIMLYRNADYIGTMSEAGIAYLKEHDPWIKATMEVCPNSQKAVFLTGGDREAIRAKYHIPQEKCVFVFGGNFGISQGIPELLKSMKASLEIEDVFFLLIGNGTEFETVKRALSAYGDDQVLVMRSLPRAEFDRLLTACDVGLISLYPRYTVPNVPSRMISYLLAELPILAAVDPATDAGDIVERAGCGIKVMNGDTEGFALAVKRFCSETLRNEMRFNSKRLMEEQFTTEIAYKIISSHFIGR